MSEWNHNEVDKIYSEADPTFRKLQTLQSWRSWAEHIRQDHGSLRNVAITSISGLLPTEEWYTVEAVMQYDQGDAKGGFTFTVMQNTPRLLGVILSGAE